MFCAEVTLSLFRSCASQNVAEFFEVSDKASKAEGPTNPIAEFLVCPFHIMDDEPEFINGESGVVKLKQPALAC